jgi:hypothetical protein
MRFVKGSKAPVAKFISLSHASCADACVASRTRQITSQKNIWFLGGVRLTLGEMSDARATLSYLCSPFHSKPHVRSVFFFSIASTHTHARLCGLTLDKPETLCSARICSHRQTAGHVRQQERKKNSSPAPISKHMNKNLFRKNKSPTYLCNLS